MYCKVLDEHGQTELREPSAGEFFTVLRSNPIAFRFVELGYPCLQYNSMLLSASFTFATLTQGPAIHAIKNVLAFCPSLRRLALTIQRIEDYEVDSFLQALAPMRKSAVRRFSLISESACLRQSTAKDLALLMPQISALRLCCGSGYITPVVDQMLPRMPNLRVLHLRGGWVSPPDLLKYPLTGFVDVSIDATRGLLSFMDSVNVMHHMMKHNSSRNCLSLSLPLYKERSKTTPYNEGTQMVYSIVGRRFHDMIRFNRFLFKRRMEFILLTAAQRVCPSIGASVRPLLPSIFRLFMPGEVGEIRDKKRKKI